MNRKNKYPETSTFHYYNANPKGKIASDCVIRAICTAMNEPYEKVYRELLEESLKCGYVLNEPRCYDRYLQSRGWVKNKQPRKINNSKYTGKEFCDELNGYGGHPFGNVIANIGGHHIVAICKDKIDYKIFDTWDSTNKSIGNYWIKQRD